MQPVMPWGNRVMAEPLPLPPLVAVHAALVVLPCAAVVWPLEQLVQLVAVPPEE